MPRPILLVLVLLLIVGGIYYLSTVPEKAPTQTIETDVQQGGNAG